MLKYIYTPAQKKVVASMLHDGKAREPGKTPEIRRAQAQRGPTSGQARGVHLLQHRVGNLPLHFAAHGVIHFFFKKKNKLTCRNGTVGSFARQDARNRHFRSQHGGSSEIPPVARTVYEKLKRPSATHPSLLPKKRSK